MKLSVSDVSQLDGASLRPNRVKNSSASVDIA